MAKQRKSNNKNQQGPGSPEKKAAPKPPPPAAAPKAFTDDELEANEPLPDMTKAVPISFGKSPKQVTEPPAPEIVEPSMFQPLASDVAAIGQQLKAAPITQFGTASTAAQPPRKERSWVGWVLLVVAFLVIGVGFWYFFLRKPSSIKRIAHVSDVVAAPVEAAPPPAPTPNYEFVMPPKG